MSNKWDELVFGLDCDGDRYKCKCEKEKSKHDHCGCKKKDDHKRECTVKFYFDCD